MYAIYEYDGISQKEIIGNEVIINDLRSRLKIGYKANDGVSSFFLIVII